MLGSYTEAAVDMLDFFERQREWSFETFGPPEHLRCDEPGRYELPGFDGGMYGEA